MTIEELGYPASIPGRIPWERGCLDPSVLSVLRKVVERGPWERGC